MRFRLPLVSIALIATVGACGKRDPVASDIKEMNMAAPANDTGRYPAGAPSRNSSKAPAGAALAQPDGRRIPVALQGRWGLTPGDCMGPLDSAKGLLVINGNALRFYESRAVPGPDVQASNLSMNGHFHFTGEGQVWDKFMALQRNGHKLKRTESNPAASYTYAKC